MSLGSKIAMGALGAAAGSLAARALGGGWKKVTGKQPPNPNDPEVPVLQALAWVAASGLIMAGAQVLVNRFGVRRWQAKVKPVTVKLDGA